MKNSLSFLKGLFVLVLMFNIGVTKAQVNQKAEKFQKKGHYYYQLFEKERSKDNYTKLFSYLQKSNIYFKRSLILYKTEPEKYKEQIKRTSTYLKIILHYRNSIFEKRRELLSSN